MAQRVAEAEPNNDQLTAQAVLTGRQVDCNLVAGEQDWFSFTTAGGQTRLTTSGAADTRILLLDSLGTVIGVNDDSRGLQSDLTINLTAGTYFARVEGFGAATTGLYSLDIAIESALKPYTGAESEPNNVITDTGVQVIGNGAQILGALGAGDVDVYRVDLTAPRSGVWFQVTEGDAPFISGHRYEVLDSAGALLAPTGTFGGNVGDTSNFTYRTSQVRCWPAGTYYIVVRERSVASTINPVPAGNYRLELQVLPMNTGVTVNEAPALDANGQTATPIVSGQQGVGNLSVANEIDLWGPITFSQPSVLQFQTGNGATSPVLDTTIGLRFFDPVTNTLGAATLVTTGNILEPTGTSHARGTFSFFLAPSTYYLEVRSPGTLATQIGNYVLEVSATEPAPYVAASYATVAANATCGVAPFPTLARQFTNEVPTVGNYFSVQLNGLTPGVAIGLLVWGTAQLPPGGLPIGIGCELNISPILDVQSFFSLTGSAEVGLTIPANPTLRGAVLWQQAAEYDGVTGFFGVQTGNYGRLIIGERSY
ncbi:MAG: hypothetical protein MUC36_08470 [Planctomycetes bacterium]|nr:hypothetical protein [Planctomycetota bacterium]